jgi:hypothetical protein
MKRAIEDELEIRSLVDRYCDAVNRRATADWRATWQPDASWELFGRPMEGLDVLTKTFEGAIAMLRFVVQTAANGVIALDGDRATGRWMMSEWSESEPLGRLLLMFIYHDEYTRSPAGWRFQSRRMQLVYQGPPDLSGKSFPPVADGA